MRILNLVLLYLCLVSGLSLITDIAQAAGPDASSADVAALRQDVDALKAQVKALQEKDKSPKLLCKDGKSVQGGKNKWSPWSACPEGSSATGLARVDIQGDHDVVTNHVNDFQCGPQGCRAWCIGNTCEVIARCCE